MNLDIPTAVQTMLGALPEVKAQRDRLAELPRFDVAAFDKLEDYVLALSSVQADYVMATQPPDDLAELNANSIALRERLTLDAKALVSRGLFDARKVAALVFLAIAAASWWLRPSSRKLAPLPKAALA